MKRSAGVVPLSVAMVVAMVSVTPSLGLTGTSDEREIDRAQRFRESFGLRSDRSFVEDTYSRANLRSDDWGVPLTETENEELYRRVRRAHAVVPAIEVARKRDGFAGLYLDQKRDGIPVFQFASKRAAAEDALKDVVSGATTFEVVKVDRSEDDLERLKNRIEARDAELADSGVDVVSILNDVRSNQLRVGVQGPVERARERLADLGAGVRVVAQDYPLLDACNGQADCPPAKGGIRIKGNKSFCTAGFMGKRLDGTPRLVLLTAGHCFAFGQQSGNKTWWHGSGISHSSGDIKVGTQDGMIWVTGQTNPKLKADVGVIDLASGFEPGEKNKLLTTNGSSGVGKVNGTTGNYIVPGWPVCAFGAGSKTKRCGEIVGASYNNKTCKNPGTGSDAEPCSKLEYTVEVDFDSTGGDSGGPYWEGPRGNDSPWIAMGIHTHSTKDNVANPFGWYVPILHVLDKLGEKGINVRLCYNTNCTQ